jgi:hypothetical protein
MSIIPLGMRWLLKKLWRGVQVGSALVDVWTLLKWLFPFLAGGIGIATGYVQGLGAMYIWLGFLGSFALATAILSFSVQWQSRSSPRYKLRLEQIMMGIADSRESNALRSVNVLQPSLVLRNLADFPLSYSVRSGIWQMANRVTNENFPMLNSGGTIEPQSTTRFTLPDIDVRGIDFSTSQQGRLAVEIMYGRPGKEKFRWSQPMILTLQRTTAPAVEPSQYAFNWYNSPPAE